MLFSTSAYAFFVLGTQPLPTVAAAKENWRVNAYTDDLCNDKTGSWSHNEPSNYESFKGLPDILSLDAKGPIGGECGWWITTYSDDEDSRAVPWEGSCLRVQALGEWKNPITGFEVSAFPCNE